MAEQGWEQDADGNFRLLGNLIVDGTINAGANSIFAANISAASIGVTGTTTTEYLTVNVQLGAPAGSINDFTCQTIEVTEEVVLHNGSISIHDPNKNSKGLGFLYQQDVVTTTDATPTTISTLATYTDSVWGVSAVVTNIKSDATKGCYIKVDAAFRNDSGVVSAIGVPNFVTNISDNVNYDVSFTISGTDVLIQVTGDAGETIDWQCNAVCSLSN